MKDKKKQKHEETGAKPHELETPTHEHTEAKKHESELLRHQLSELQKEKDELFGRLQRLSADYANFQKRVPKQIDDSVAYQKEAMVKSLLSVLDNFGRTLQNAQSSENIEALTKGVRIIYDHMVEILKSHGVEQIKAHGEKFDPVVHEAMLSKSEADKEDDTVLEELAKGYKLNGRVIRPSKVVVNKRQAQQAPTQPPEQPTDKIADQAQTAGDFETTDTE